ncbi:sensor histidine kinase [Pseudobacter ginsenosidimutans]|jgi:signal transduction histidine kinase|uniref:histidine kinase n=1 Tax=Pseudobacter ginsenosidimutans TaxID=661488 RepID=A0A4Q7MB25_9BACT|nr:HAMP domain-containing sensor histidine kinase [Pseudobacter ginsenosidimutans]QEC42654.1 HAMP domain-containing histidine kinase [Pseudobacter ginsenosidimutans]RZS65196.1 signal transduction histidine kinase [Pseudobacter ginsenosidimutans]
MKLLTKLTLFTTISKLAIVLLFVWLLPVLADKVAFEYANNRLKQQERKVFAVIEKNGIDYYLEGDSTYGSYTMLKEEYISLERNQQPQLPDTILTSQRIVEGDTLTYRTLIANFEYDQHNYTLEIGKTIASIRQYNTPLQRVALYVLAALVFLTLLLDLSVTRLLIRPLARIIRTKLVNAKFPFTKSLQPIQTSTTDFKYLDQSLMLLMQRITGDFERERAFTSNASHELMTPISVLQTKMENFMLGTDNEEEQRKILDMMKILNRLKKIVNALLMISRIENEQYNKTGSVSMHELISEITGELAAGMENKGLELTVSLRKDISLQPLNPDLIFQLFYNIITNAIRYNIEGGRIIITDRYSREEGFSISIRDTGIGIPEEEREAVFNRFRKSSLTGIDGNGLGLSIVKSIAQYHGIGLELQSVQGKGTEFIVRFPPAMVGQIKI